jgi:cysteine synthase A
MKADSVLATIGKTPHIRLSRLFPDHEVWVKSERGNRADRSRTASRLP